MAEKASPDRHISVKEMECLKEAFALFDRDRDGEISTEELGKVRCEVRECLCVELVSLSWILAHWKRQFESQQRFVKNRCLITRGFWYKTTRTSCATDKQAPHRTRMSMLILFLAMTNLTSDIKWSDIWDCWPTNTIKHFSSVAALRISASWGAFVRLCLNQWRVFSIIPGQYEARETEPQKLLK